MEECKGVGGWLTPSFRVEFNFIENPTSMLRRNERTNLSAVVERPGIRRWRRERRDAFVAGLVGPRGAQRRTVARSLVLGKYRQKLLWPRSRLCRKLKIQRAEGNSGDEEQEARRGEASEVKTTKRWKGGKDRERERERETGGSRKGKERKWYEGWKWKSMRTEKLAARRDELHSASLSRYRGMPEENV